MDIVYFSSCVLPNPQVVDLVTSGFALSAFLCYMTTHPVYPDPQEMTPLGGGGKGARVRTHLLSKYCFHVNSSIIGFS